MQARALRAADFRRMRWSNGGGWTTELARAPQGDDTSAFDWRISIADVERDGAFSAFPGCDRYIALLDGVGMQLQFDAAPVLRLDQRLQFFPFAGEWQAHARLLSGPVRDFNLIVRRNVIRAEVLRRPLVGPMVFLADAQTTWFVYVVGGQATLKDAAIELEAGEAMLLEPDADTRNRVLSGGGELVLIKLVRA